MVSALSCSKRRRVEADSFPFLPPFSSFLPLQFVACPLHKRQYALDDGDCLNDNDYSIITFDAKEEDGDLYIRLPPVDELDAVLGTSKVRSQPPFSLSYIPLSPLSSQLRN